MEIVCEVDISLQEWYQMYHHQQNKNGHKMKTSTLKFTNATANVHQSNLYSALINFKFCRMKSI